MIKNPSFFIDALHLKALEISDTFSAENRKHAPKGYLKEGTGDLFHIANVVDRLFDEGYLDTQGNFKEELSDEDVPDYAAAIMGDSELVAGVSESNGWDKTLKMVEIPEFCGPYPAYVDDNQRWNGWLCPSFDKEVVDRIIADLENASKKSTNEDFTALRWDGDDVVEYNVVTGTEYDRFTKGDDGRWGVGSYAWVWEYAEEDANEAANYSDFTNIGRDEEGNILGNCKVCGAKGTIIDGHVHRGTDPVSASQNLPSSLQEKKDKLMKFLEKFPKDATNWNQATEELKDIYESLLDYSDNVIEDVNTSSSKTPAEYNTKFRDAIDKIIELCPEALGGLFRYYGAWFNENQKAKENDLEKGGEGSKGGKIIGHTQSGKPIYDSHNHHSHANFTSQDHLDAVKVHSTLSRDYKHYSEEAKNHIKQAQEHDMSSQALPGSRQLSKFDKESVTKSEESDLSQTSIESLIQII